MTEQFNLSWKEHELNTARILHSLRDDDQLCDVTIACEEGVFLGHKIVLFASSLLFRNILKKHTHPHPLIYLKNITGRDMASLLDFMYYGEVKLEKEQLTSFSAAAEELQVLGLTSSSSSHVKNLSRKCSAAHQSEEVLPSSSAQPIDPWKVPIDEILQSSTDNQTYKSRASIPLSNTQNTNCKTNIKLESVLETSEYEIQPFIETTEFQIQQHPKLTDSSDKTALQESQQRISISGQGLVKKSQSVASNGSPGIKDYKDLQNYVIKGEKIRLKGQCRRRYECVICGTASVNKGHLLAHIEGKHFHRVLKYTCNRCGRSQGNRESAKSHMKRCQVFSAS